MINFGKTAVALGSVGSRVAVTGAASFGTTGSDLGTEFSSSILEGLVNTDSDKELYDLYREIYMMDTVSGPAVDIMASLPWSDCNLMGVDDTKQLQVYEDTLGELGLTSTMTALSTAYLVLGKAIGSLLFDSERGIFTDIITHNPDMCEITPIPLRGYDPKIDLRLDQEFKKFLASKDPRDVEARKEISPQLMQKLKSGKIELEPLSTLYIQRAVIPGIDSMSYYTRVLPIWLIEKALMRGTIIGAWRRQRSILHVMAGDEDWEPTDEQLAMFTQLFQNADRDPQGAVVTTRNGVQVQEVRQGNDFWKISDEWDIFANAKMRALGISEAFLSGEATYSNAEVALSVFMENLRTFRDTMTSAILYDKIFLLLAKYHGFKTRTKAEINNRLRLSDSERNRDPYGRKRQAGMYASRNLAEAAQYNIPTVHWSKELKAVGDSSVLELLRSAQENNIPIPLAMIATACGVSLSAVIDSFEEDVEQRRIIKKHVQTLHKEGLDNLTADSEGDGGDGSSDYERGGMDSMFGSTIPSPNKSPVVLATNKSGNPKFDTILGNLVQSLPPDIIMSKEKARKVLNYAFKLSRQARKNGAANRIF